MTRAIYKLFLDWCITCCIVQ